MGADPDDFTGTGRSGPMTGGGPARCFIATAAYGSELSPSVQFLREFRDNIVLKSRFRGFFEKILEIYYTFSPCIARKMEEKRVFKYFMKYMAVLPFLIIARACAHIIKLFTKSQY